MRKRVQKVAAQLVCFTATGQLKSSGGPAQQIARPPELNTQSQAPPYKHCVMLDLDQNKVATIWHEKM